MAIQDEKPVLVGLPEIDFIDEKIGKPVETAPFGYSKEIDQTRLKSPEGSRR